jgi:DNA-binding MarR family transcriptional regulator
MTHDARDRECAKPMSSALQKNGAAAPEPAPKNFKFGYLVHDVSRMRRTVMDQAMRPLGVTRSQWTVLSALARGGNDGMMQVDLARLLEVGKVTVGGLVDRLEATGHVERRGDAADRRVKRVYITEQGVAVIRQMMVVSAAINERILRNIAPEYQRIAEEVLFSMKQNLKEIAAETAQDATEAFGSGLGRQDG